MNCACGKFGLQLKKFELKFSSLFDKFKMVMSSGTSGNQCFRQTAPLQESRDAIRDAP